MDKDSRFVRCTHWNFHKDKTLNFVPYTVSRELLRNIITTGQYDPNTDLKRSLMRHLHSKSKRICENITRAVEFMIKLDWSPE